MKSLPIAYWGDMDVEGYEALSALRQHFPQTKSFRMDFAALKALEHLHISGTGRVCDRPSYLTESESKAFDLCLQKNFRIEQERIPQLVVIEDLG